MLRRTSVIYSFKFDIRIERKASFILIIFFFFFGIVCRRDPSQLLIVQTHSILRKKNSRFGQSFFSSLYNIYIHVCIVQDYGSLVYTRIVYTFFNPSTQYARNKFIFVFGIRICWGQKPIPRYFTGVKNRGSEWMPKTNPRVFFLQTRMFVCQNLGHAVISSINRQSDFSIEIELMNRFV